jgi:hypothetical protein
MYTLHLQPEEICIMSNENSSSVGREGELLTIVRSDQAGVHSGGDIDASMTQRLCYKRRDVLVQMKGNSSNQDASFKGSRLSFASNSDG